MNKTLALIFTALALMIGSFIWFVATWDASKEEPIGFVLPKILAPQGPSPATGTVFIVKGTT